MDILAPSGNIGGHIAHIGGAFYGYLNIKLLINIKLTQVHLLKKYSILLKKIKSKIIKKLKVITITMQEKKREQEKLIKF